jgi:hypothetical protein
MYRVVDRDGNLVELDDDEVVRDGQVLRVAHDIHGRHAALDGAGRLAAAARSRFLRGLQPKPLTSPRKCRRSVKRNLDAFQDDALGMC